MTSDEARKLEKSLTTDDAAFIRRAGTIKITDVDSGESTIHATYSAAEVLNLLAAGHSIDEILSMLD